MANRTQWNRGVGRRKDGTFVPAADMVFVGIKMSPHEVALVDSRNRRRHDGGRGPALRSALQSVEDLQGWVRSVPAEGLDVFTRAQLGLILDESDVVADAVLVALEHAAGVASRQRLTDELGLEFEDLEGPLAILAAEGLLEAREVEVTAQRRPSPLAKARLQRLQLNWPGRS